MRPDRVSTALAKWIGEVSRQETASIYCSGHTGHWRLAYGASTRQAERKELDICTVAWYGIV